MNGPACNVCGGPQRWIAERNSWGCDACQRLHSPRTLPGHDAPPRLTPLAYAPARPGVIAGAGRSPSQPTVAPPAPVPIQTPPPDSLPPSFAPTPYYDEAPAAPRASPSGRRWLIGGLIVALAGVVVAIVVVATREDEVATAAPETCATALGQSLGRSQTVLAKLTLDRDGAALLERKLVALCEGDAWPASVIACVASAAADDTARCLDARASARVLDVVELVVASTRAQPPQARPTPGTTAPQRPIDPLPPEERPPARPPRR